MDGIVGCYTVDEHWEACESCVFWCEEKCIYGIRWIDDHRVRDNMDGEYICTLYKEGIPPNMEEALFIALQIGIIIDAPGQRFLFDSMEPVTISTAVQFIIDGDFLPY